MDGLLVVDKPAGPTSHDVVARVRRVLRERRAGHTGTLDPAATGLLLIVLGRATRLARFLSATDKTYEAVIRLGIATDSGDAEGTPLGEPYAGPLPSEAVIDQALDSFRGTYLQQPPVYSAKKIGGKRSYRLARSGRRDQPGPKGPGLQGEGPGLRAVSVTVRRLMLTSVVSEYATVVVDCSSGFYVRSLAHDVGARLGTGAHLASLRRIRNGDYAIESAITLEAAEHDPAAAAAAVNPMSRILSSLESVILTAEGVRFAAHGRDLSPSVFRSPVPSPQPPTGAVRLLSEAGELVGIAEPAARSAAPGSLHPFVVLM